MSLYLESMSSTVIQCFSIWLPTVFIEAHYLPIWLIFMAQSRLMSIPCLLNWILIMPLSLANVSLSGPMTPYLATVSLYGPMSTCIRPNVSPPRLARCCPIWPNVCLSGAMSAYLTKCLLSGAMTAYLAKCLVILS
jgi:hypothetical protein